MIAAVLSLSGPTLTPDERALFAAARPPGVILFARNCIDHDQLRALTDTLRDLLGADLLIFIDQEGGRVARLRPPHWPAFPPAARFAALYALQPLSAIEAARLNGLALAATLRACGINVNCAPVLDLPQPDAHAIIGDRAFGTDPAQVAALGGATLVGLHAGGVVGVVKHLPGHGRARADSHLELPVVTASAHELEHDFAPFCRLATRSLIGMTAHVTYSALAPDCASLSATVIEGTIRQRLGFDGLLVSDDLGMAALTGPLETRAQAVLAAGCDLALHCSGAFAEMAAIAEAVTAPTPAAQTRLAHLLPVLAAVAPPGSWADDRDRLLALAD